MNSWCKSMSHCFTITTLKLLKVLPYRPDLTPCDFPLFSHLKIKLKGRHFSNMKKTFWRCKTMSIIPNKMCQMMYKNWFWKMERCMLWKLSWKNLINKAIFQKFPSTLCTLYWIIFQTNKEKLWQIISQFKYLNSTSSIIRKTDMNDRKFR